MLDRLNLLSNHFNVSGCEEKMRIFLASRLKEIGLEAKVDKTGCLYCKKLCSDRKKRSIMICVPMDVPGYLALYVNKNYGYLVSTAKMPEGKTKSIKLMAEDGRMHNATLLTDDGTERKVYKKGVSLADAFRLDPSPELKNDIVSGFFSTTIARIQMLLELASEPVENDVTFLFTASSCTRAAKEKNVAKRIKPDYMVLIGAVETDESQPLLLLKDGSAFSDEELKENFQKSQGKNRFKTALFSEPVTKAAEVHSAEGVPILSLALPYSLKDGKECFSLKSYESLFCGLKNFIVKKQD